MNLFDLVAGLVLLVSALIGFSRGVVLEVVALFAFTLAATSAVYLLPFTGPLAARNLHPAWAANAAAIGLAFLIVYVGVRLFGANLSRAIRGQSTLGTLDRTVGLAFGVVRAMVVLGVVYLVFSAAPQSEPPPVLTQARLYPLARGAGLTLASLAPGGMHAMEGFGAGMKSRMGAGDPLPPDDPGQASDPGQAGDPAADAVVSPAPYVDGPSPVRTLQIDGASHRHHRQAPAQVE